MNMKRMKTGVAAIASVTLPLLALTASPTVAWADENTYDGETYCGTVYSGAAPAEDPFAAFNDMSNDFYDGLFEKAGGPRELCGPYHWLIEQGAQWVVKKHTPAWLDRGLDVVTVHNDLNATAPAMIPAVGPNIRTYPVSWTNGLGLWLRGGPGGGSSTIVVMPEGTQLAIECQTDGEVIDGPYGATGLWNRVTYDGVTGYASDAYINTGTDGQAAPTC